MAHQYVASVPEDGSLKPGIASFFESFYAVSDTAVAHEQYADHFTSDATLIMASKETKGRAGKSSRPFHNSSTCNPFVRISTIQSNTETQLFKC